MLKRQTLLWFVKAYGWGSPVRGAGRRGQDQRIERKKEKKFSVNGALTGTKVPLGGTARIEGGGLGKSGWRVQ